MTSKRYYIFNYDLSKCIIIIIILDLADFKEDKISIKITLVRSLIHPAKRVYIYIYIYI